MSPFFIQAEDSVSIFNILIKLFHIGIRDKCFKTYFTSKARARFINILSDEFFINQGVNKVVHYILYYLTSL